MSLWVIRDLLERSEGLEEISSFRKLVFAIARQILETCPDPFKEKVDEDKIPEDYITIREFTEKTLILSTGFLSEILHNFKGTGTERFSKNVQHKWYVHQGQLENWLSTQTHFPVISKRAIQYLKNKGISV